MQKFIQPHSNDRNPDRRLRIGYLSPDLREHPVGRNLLPLLSNHDHEQFEVFCYSNVTRPDAITARIRSYADRWREIARMSDEQADQLIREDQIDLLIDPTGHTAHNRLLLLARQPAPVQASWFFSTGVSAIEYRLTDRYCDPPEAGEAFAGERAIRLPHCFWCFEPIEPSLPVNALPALAAGHLTFGCFNNFCKINPFVLGLWIQILQAVPGSRLILRCPPGEHREQLLGTFEAAGIAPGRLELVFHTPRLQYYQRYHQIDICLDPTPFSGHTTSFDVLWMGVALVSLAGSMAVGRSGVSFLSNVGLSELIAGTPQDYVSIAVKLATDLPRLAEMRASLREKVLASPLVDARGYARDTEAAYRRMWRNWCEKTSEKN
jgi:predicted O-linked N-acetylglucosamine transferase (SPINDLY family)